MEHKFIHASIWQWRQKLYWRMHSTNTPTGKQQPVTISYNQADDNYVIFIFPKK